MFKKSIIAIILSCIITVPVYADEPIELEYKTLDSAFTMAKCVEAEAGNQDYLGKCLVTQVIVNRIHNELFPNSVEDVIFQKGQFTVTTNGAFDKAWPSDETLEAVRAIYLEGENIDTDILFFSRGKGPGSGHYKYGDHWFSGL